MSSPISISRRRMIASSAVAAAGLLAGSLPALGRVARTRPEKKSILILGGTQFIGPAAVAYAISRGHSVTVFNRGITEKRKGDLPDGVTRLVGDRDPNVGDGLKALEGKKFDAVIDTSGYYPRHVKASAELLAPNVGQYIFVSSISAYARNDKPNSDETAELATLTDPTVETMGRDGEYYGGLKVLCEQACEAAMPGRTTIVRPGYIVGPLDPTDRFTYWPVRCARGGKMIVPGTPNDVIQIIDVRDLSEWMIHMVENGTVGTFNACGPDKPLTMGAMLDACRQACPSDSPGRTTEFTWVSAAFLRELPESVWFPIWIPAEGEYAGFHTWSNERAMKAGLTFRPVSTTIKDILEWFPGEIERRVRVTAELREAAKAKGEPFQEPPDVRGLRAGPTAAQEEAILKAWNATSKGERDVSGKEGM